jgi:hypothetical protein
MGVIAIGLMRSALFDLAKLLPAFAGCGNWRDAGVGANGWFA